MERKIKFVVYNRNTGEKQNKLFDTLKDAIAEACKQNDKINRYDFLITSVKQ